MEMTKVTAVAICGVLFSLLLKERNQSASICVTLATTLVIASFIIGELRLIVVTFLNILEQGNVSSENYKSLMKVIGVAYFTEIGSGICKDAGESAIAAKVDIAGRICILYFTLPVISQLMEVIISTLSLI